MTTLHEGAKRPSYTLLIAVTGIEPAYALDSYAK
jgi:hypothetical protein